MTTNNRHLRLGSPSMFLCFGFPRNKIVIDGVLLLGKKQNKIDMCNGEWNGKWSIEGFSTITMIWIDHW